MENYCKEHNIKYQNLKQLAETINNSPIQRAIELSQGIYNIFSNEQLEELIKKEINYKNRGMDLENLINDACKYYLEHDLAVIYKKPTPIGIVDVDYKNGATINKAYFKEPSTLDYNGIWQGKYVEFDAKECKSKTSFPLNNIHLHQINHIKKIMLPN